MNILLPVRFHISNTVIPPVWDKSYGTIRIPALTCYLSLLPIPLGLGVARSDSCEKEYLKRLPRLCWVMIVTPNWPHEFPVVIFSFLFLGFLHICGFILLLAELEFKNFSRFSRRPICCKQYSNVSQLGQLGGESGWDQLRGNGHEPQQVFVWKTRVFLQSPSILTTDSATHVTKCHPRFM